MYIAAKQQPLTIEIPQIRFRTVVRYHSSLTSRVGGFGNRGTNTFYYLALTFDGQVLVLSSDDPSEKTTISFCNLTNIKEMKIRRFQAIFLTNNGVAIVLDISDNKFYHCCNTNNPAMILCEVHELGNICRKTTGEFLEIIDDNDALSLGLIEDHVGEDLYLTVADLNVGRKYYRCVIDQHTLSLVITDDNDSEDR